MSVKTAKWRIAYAMSSHMSRTSYEVRDTQVHSCAPNNFFIPSRDTLENNFWTFQNFRHGMARTTSPDPHRSRIPRTLSRVLPSLARQIACHGVNRLSCECEACFDRKQTIVSYVISVGGMPLCVASKQYSQFFSIHVHGNKPSELFASWLYKCRIRLLSDLNIFINRRANHITIVDMRFIFNCISPIR